MVLEEICLLAASIAQSSRVSVAYRKTGAPSFNIIAQSVGPQLTLDARYKLPLLGPKHPVLHVRDARKVPEFLNHAVHELEPNLKSVAAYVIDATPEGSYDVVIWNPSPRYFDNSFSISAMERLRAIIRAVLIEAIPPEIPPHLWSQPAPATPGLSESPAVAGSEPASHFLFDTLVDKQRLLARNGCSYLAIKAWRKQIKPYQIDALAALKLNPPDVIVSHVAREMSDAVTKVYGTAFQLIVPVPSGSSGSADGFSVLIARQMAKNLGINFADVLISSPVKKGASHPRKSAALEPYQVKGSIAGNVLIVDDVATSGRHIELATTALRPLTPFCTAIAWIAD